MPVSGFESLYEDMRRHALKEYPKEACGIVSKGHYIPMENRAEDPCQDFVIVPEAILQYSVQAVFHSHPDAPDAPSETDMRGQMAMDVPWLICSVREGTASVPWAWGDSLPMVDFTGREFRHGPSGTDGKGDCYALIRDWYRSEWGVILPDFPRSDNWWNCTDGNLYLDHFKDAGFRELSRDESSQDGDVFLMKLLSPRVNHGGVLTDDCRLILHHISGRLSRKEPLGRWGKFIDRWVRYQP